MSRAVGIAGALLLSGLAFACRSPAPRATPPAPSAEPSGSDAVLLLRGAHVLTAAGPELARADVRIRGARIEAVGEDLEVPTGARVIDASDRWITPGLVDPHSHLGVYAVPMVWANSDGNEMSD